MDLSAPYDAPKAGVSEAEPNMEKAREEAKKEIVTFSPFMDRMPLTPYWALKRIKSARPDSFSEKVDLMSNADLQQRLELWFLVEDALIAHRAFYSATQFIRKKSMITEKDQRLWRAVKKVIGPDLCDTKVHIVAVLQKAFEKKSLDSVVRPFVEHCLGPRLHAVMTMAQAVLKEEAIPSSAVSVLLGLAVFAIASLALIKKT